MVPSPPPLCPRGEVVFAVRARAGQGRAGGHRGLCPPAHILGLRGHRLQAHVQKVPDAYALTLINITPLSISISIIFTISTTFH